MNKRIQPRSNSDGSMFDFHARSRSWAAPLCHLTHTLFESLFHFGQLDSEWKRVVLRLSVRCCVHPAAADSSPSLSRR